MAPYKRASLINRRHIHANPKSAIRSPMIAFEPFQIRGANPDFFAGLAVALPIALGLWVGLAGMVALLL